MPRKKKGELPSGSIRVQKCIGHTAEGKRIMKSFTGKTKDEAERAYKRYLLTADEPAPSGSGQTVHEAVEQYIAIKSEVLSPSTLRDYEGILRRHLTNTPIAHKSVDAVTAKDVQFWVNSLAVGRSPKTVRNAHALLSSALALALPDAVFRVTLPAPKKPELYCPSDTDIKKLIAACGDDKELRLAVLLGAFGPLRRSEICALDADDIKNGKLTVSKAMVKNPDGKWVIKQPKTLGSYRTIELPPIVLSELSGVEGRLITATPGAISSRFEHALNRAGVPKFRFHDLRHYSASIMHAIGVPDQYIMQRGGWSSDYVMKRVYRDVIEDEAVKQNEKITDHFTAVVG